MYTTLLNSIENYLNQQPEVEQGLTWVCTTIKDELPRYQNNTNFHEDFSNFKSEKNPKNNQIEISKETNVDFKINKKNKYSKTSNFFSYLIVVIISFIALIILVDTIKSPLINIFPGLEIVLFNLFETLKDVRLFITDLT